MNRLVAIVGPTGVGKSRLAGYLAGVFNGEIISADSRQVYRHLDIGTDKPLPQELSRVPHHLINIIDPNQDFGLAQYQAMACDAIEDIQRRRKLPFFTGGSGLYIWAVLEGWRIPRVSPDPELRYNLEKRASDAGIDELYQELVKIDPQAAQKIDYRNVRRVVRALEVNIKTKTPFSQLRHKEAPAFNFYIIGLTADRAELYRRVDQRVDAMFKRGFVTEVENLLKMGYDLNLPAMSGIGYRQIGKFLKGELSLDLAKQQIKSETHRLVRHQYAWFRLTDRRIHWFDVQRQQYLEMREALADFMRNNT
ncbi:MAG: tRNA (adenosine(37)-N6)-dimethylallyltransferase MiaA [Chloroflexi bacterium RBG_16_50_9]|nr:MAG: tRNA (adenosine(37)-N6)-dimethylallyltransferase MiaA [Chloroflexi bacterium RBG_16_50_9]